jgi:luciferase family oxidoreductase group 1
MSAAGADAPVDDDAGAYPVAMAIPLSVLDLVPVRKGGSVHDAYDESIALARHVEGLGYRRYWFAEHHGAPGIASAAPAVLIARIAAATSTLRVGSGGVMLPNHAPLAIAEQFGTLEALFPGRIDLGIGRAPGTDPLTAQALRGSVDVGADDFPEQLDDVFAFFRGADAWPLQHPYRRIQATPATGHEPPVWLLGSSDFSARLAGRLGLPFSFAHHFSQENTLPALRIYRASFERAARPGALAAPLAMVAALIIVADDDDTAVENAMPMALAFLRMRQGRAGQFPTLDDVAAHPWTAPERAFVADWLDKNIVGGPATVRQKLAALTSSTQADEVMVLSTAPTPAARQRSYTLLKELHG